LRVRRALLGIAQLKLAELAGLSLPTHHIQRMEASDGVIGEAAACQGGGRFVAAEGLT